MRIKSFIATAIFSFIALVSLAQERTVINSFEVTYDEKIPTKKDDVSSYLVLVYQKKEGENLWAREMFDNRKQDKLISKGYSADSLGMIKEGCYTYYHYGTTHELKKGNFINNKKQGVWQYWNENGVITGKENYRDDHMVGLNLRLHNDGSIMDSIGLDENGNGYGKSYSKDGWLTESGSYKIGEKEGEWNYYYDSKDSIKCMVAQYINGEANSYLCFNEKGEKMKKDDCTYEREASFPKGDNGWVKFLSKVLGDFDAASMGIPKGKYTVLLKFIVDKTGDVIDVEIEEPSKSVKFNERALLAIKEGPKWIPAIQYNRPIKAYRRQPIVLVVD